MNNEILFLMDENNFSTVEYEKKLENLYENYNLICKEKNIEKNEKILSSNNKKLFKIILNLKKNNNNNNK
jgi:hypothetical protein